MPKVVVNGVSTHYQTRGEGPDVFLVHGLTANLAFWYNAKVFPVLSKDYRVTAYDLRGHGYSDLTPTGYTSESLAHDLRALMDQLGVEKARVIGHSYGGSIALHFALLYPERTAGVIICDTGFAALRHLRKIEDWPGWNIWKEQLPEYGITYDWFVEEDQKGIDGILRKSLDIPVQFGVKRGQPRAARQLQTLLDETTLAKDFRDPAGLTEDKLPNIAPPVLAVYGQISPFQDVSLYMQQTLPRCRAEMLPESGHFFLMDGPDTFLERIDPFLKDPAGYCAAAPNAAPASNATTDQEPKP